MVGELGPLPLAEATAHSSTPDISAIELRLLTPNSVRFKGDALLQINIILSPALYENRGFRPKLKFSD